jgi:membrane-anchored mycosin MYCP
VINISEAACYKSTRPIDEATVGAAINFAVNIKGAIVVVAAGNTGQDSVSIVASLLPARTDSPDSP